MGWAAFFHPSFDPMLTNIAPYTTFFGCGPLIFSFFGHIFPHLDLGTTLRPNYPIDLATLLTYIFTYLPTNTQPLYLPTHPPIHATYLPSILIVSSLQI